MKMTTCDPKDTKLGHKFLQKSTYQSQRLFKNAPACPIQFKHPNKVNPPDTHRQPIVSEKQLPSTSYSSALQISPLLTNTTANIATLASMTGTSINTTGLPFLVQTGVQRRDRERWACQNK